MRIRAQGRCCLKATALGASVRQGAHFFYVKIQENPCNFINIIYKLFSVSQFFLIILTVLLKNLQYFYLRMIEGIIMQCYDGRVGSMNCVCVVTETVLIKKREDAV